MTLRLACALICFLTAGTIGMRWSNRLKAETARLAAWLTLLDRLRLTFSQGAHALPDALEAASDAQSDPDALLRTLAGLLRSRPASGLYELYRSVCENDAPENGIIDRLMSALDRGTLEARLLSIDHAQESLRMLHEAQAARTSRDAPMWTRLGWTAGACLMILMM